MKVSILLCEECIPSCVVGILDMFDTVNEYLRRTPDPRCSQYEVNLVSLQSRTVRINKLSFACDHTLQEAPPTDLIIIPALHPGAPMILEKYQKVIPWLRARYLDQQTELASICTGAYLLAATGLIDGRACSTHWAAAEAFREMFPGVKLQSQTIITDEEGIYTSGGATSFYNLVLYIIEKSGGREVALWTAKMFLIDMDRVSQSHFTIFHPQKNHHDRSIIKAQDFIEQNYRQELRVDALAAQVGLSKRNFIRRFKKATHNTPIQYIQRVKIEAAKKVLETTSATINEVMYQSGYSDMKSFRTLFKKMTGLTPTAYRKKYNYAILAPLPA
ncbi:MAG: GlxA family transcriptional regulator [Rhodothermales bacterium]